MKATGRQLLAVFLGYAAYIWAAQDFINSMAWSLVFNAHPGTMILILVVLAAPMPLVSITGEAAADWQRMKQQRQLDLHQELGRIHEQQR